MLADLELRAPSSDHLENYHFLNSTSIVFVWKKFGKTVIRV